MNNRRELLTVILAASGALLAACGGELLTLADIPGEGSLGLR